MPGRSSEVPAEFPEGAVRINQFEDLDGNPKHAD